MYTIIDDCWGHQCKIRCKINSTYKKAFYASFKIVLTFNISIIKHFLCGSIM